MRRWGALAALAVSGTSVGRAQDSLPPPVARHVLAFDLARVQPFHRQYDVIIQAGDSTTWLGRREVAFSEAQLPDSTSGWLLTETRDGLAPAADSLFLGPDLRPVRWTAASGGAHVELDFADDSVHGAVRSTRSTAPVAAESPPDLITSAPMLELILGLVPLSAGWSDSAHMLATSLAGARVSPVELLVMGEDSTETPGGQYRAVWLVGLNADAGRVMLSVDKLTGALVRSQQSLPPHGGSVLEYRERVPISLLPPQ